MVIPKPRNAINKLSLPMNGATKMPRIEPNALVNKNKDMTTLFIDFGAEILTLLTKFTNKSDDTLRV